MLKRNPRAEAHSTTMAFISAEEAWFWFVRCQVLRREGACLKSSSQRNQRPCDPDDIYRVLMALSRTGKINQVHLRVLGHFGLVGRPPDPRSDQEVVAFGQWNEALDRLATVLFKKGLIQCAQ